MNQLDDIVSLFGAVDDILRTPTLDAEVRGRIATVLPSREVASTDGWFREFNDWLDRRADRPDAGWFPTVEDALADLAEQGATGTLETRRLLAIAALSRADPGRFGPEGEQRDLVRGALAPLVPELGSESDSAAARVERLHQILAGADPELLLADVGQWGPFVAVAKAQFLLRSSTIPFPPCSSMSLIDPGQGADPIMSLATDFVAAGLTLADVQDFLEPANWPHCADLWISMTPIPPASPPAPRYLEVIGSTEAIGWKLTTALDFNRRARPGQISVGYVLPPNQPGLGGDGWVDVDQGSITVKVVPAGVEVRTVKRLRFRGLPLGQFSADLLCALGWASQGQDMVFRCARLQAKVDTPWRSDPMFAPAPDPTSTTPDAPTDPARQAPQERIDRTVAAVDDLAELTGAAVVECAKAFASSYAKAEAGTYGSEALAADVAASVGRASDDLSRIAALGLRTFLEVVKDDLDKPAKAGGERILESQLYVDPRTAVDEVLVLNAPLVGDFHDTIRGEVLTLSTPNGPRFKLRCRVAPGCCGTYWGQVDVVRNGKPDPNAAIPVEILVH